MKSPTIKELTVFCREWQKTLRLQDWRVKIVLADKHEIADKQADVYIVPKCKQAKIRVNLHCQSEEFADPWEVAVLHELVHLHIEPIVDKELSNERHMLYEQAVDLLAWGLYHAKYGNKAVDKFTS